MTNNSVKTDGRVKFGRVAPTIPVTDMDRAKKFYCGVLDFEATFENGNPVGFVILKRDAAELHLTLAKNHRPSDRNLAHMLVTDSQAFYDHLIATETRIIKSLREVVPGMQGFVFADPDGNRIDVGNMN